MKIGSNGSNSYIVPDSIKNDFITFKKLVYFCLCYYFRPELDDGIYIDII
jgi:hypothetical protein